MPTSHGRGEPLHVAFIWNQHQPSYKDPATGAYTLPWVRLHGAKDYLAMAAILEQYPTLHATFNMTPSLIVQIEDYAGGMADLYEEVSLRPADRLTSQEKEFLRRNFFYRPGLANHGGDQRFRHLNDLALAVDRGKTRFSTQDYRDLQTLFNLAWIDQELRSRDPKLEEILDKRRGFTEEDKAVVLAAHRKFMVEILPLHRRLQNRGQIELMTTPYYHPILPLLADVRSARRPSPGLNLPERPFAWPEDAAAQIKKAMALHARVFGKAPAGLWPSELAVSAECVPIAAAAGIRWMVTDETILAQSLEVSLRTKTARGGHIPHQKFVAGNSSPRLLHPELLYRPYLVEQEGRTVTVLFRDEFLSDLVGYQANRKRNDLVAKDMVARLVRIHDRLKGRRGPHLVTIALDGENAWEHFTDDKNLFFPTLYGLLAKEPRLKLVTVSEHLAAHPATVRLPELATGSWSLGELTRWVGSPTKNAAWDILAQARMDLSVAAAGRRVSRERLALAREALYAAEGSDYTWWFDSMPDVEAGPFDDIYRLHLSHMYHHLDQDPPAALGEPLIKSRRSGKHRNSRRAAAPQLSPTVAALVIAPPRELAEQREP